MSSDGRPAPSPLVPRSSQRSSTFSSIRSSSNNAAGSFVCSVKKTAKDAMDADVPLGAWAATAQSTAKAPTLGDIRQGSFCDNSWTLDGQKDANEGRVRRASSGCSGRIPKLRSAAGAGIPQVDSVQEHQQTGTKHDKPTPVLTGNQADDTWNPSTRNGTLHEEGRPEAEDPLSPIDSKTKAQHAPPIISRDHRVYSSGWQPPPKLPWTKSWVIGLKAFGKWAITPFGFLVTVYCLNIVAWGGMLFLLLCGAAPEMCWAPVGNGEYVRDCNHIDSPRRIWLEIDSQILNGLFCVTGFGLLPWRAREMYFLLRWRLCSEKKHGHIKKMYGLRKLAGYNKGWVRLPGSDTLGTLSLAEYNAQVVKDGPSTSSDNSLLHGEASEAGETDANDPRLPLPLTKTPDLPLTGVRAPPTKLWKLEFYIWCNMWNTFFQACLCGFMWGLNRYDRPSWSTGFFIACACIIAAVGGIVSFKEGKKIKRVEGVNPSPAVMEELRKMQQQKDGLELASTNETVEYNVRPDPKGKMDA